MKPSKSNLSRRSLLRGAISASVFLGTLGKTRRILSETLGASDDHRFVACYLRGGWDVLLGPDARDPSGNFPGIDLGTGLLAAEFQTPMNVRIGGIETLWGASMAPLVPHLDVTTVFRGVNMNTVAHPTGRAYVNSFIAPAGVQTRGSSLATVASSVGPLLDERTLPNVSIGIPSFNTSYPPELTSVPLAQAPEIIDLLRPGQSALPDDVEALLRQAQDDIESCVSNKYSGAHPVEALREARERVRKLLRDDVGRFFDLGGSEPGIMDLRARYGLEDRTHIDDPTAPGVVAAITSQLIKTGLSRSVTCELQGGFDTHSNWAVRQPIQQKEAFLALATLLEDLRTDDPTLCRTTVVLYSEFARTPLLNGQQGRDHWFANSMMVFGGGLKRGVIGASRMDNLGLQKVSPITGRPDPMGIMLLPEHVGATIIAGMGGDASPFRVSPLSAWVAGAGT